MPTCLSDEEVHELTETARESGQVLDQRILDERKTLIMLAVTAAGVRNQTELVVRHYSSQIDSVVLAVLLRKMNDFDRALASWNPQIAKQLGSIVREGAEKCSLLDKLNQAAQTAALLGRT